MPSEKKKRKRQIKVKSGLASDAILICWNWVVSVSLESDYLSLVLSNTSPHASTHVILVEHDIRIKAVVEEVGNIMSGIRISIRKRKIN